MTRLVEHIPGFVDGVRPSSAEVESVVDLEGVDWVRRWRDVPGFHRFSADRSQEGAWLMAERDGGKWWWVVARILGDLPGLPTWAPMRCDACERLMSHCECAKSKAVT